MDIEHPEPEPPRLGDRVTARIESIALGGDGVARARGFTVFVPRSSPGDVAEVEITHVSRNFGRGRLLSLLEAGPDRAVPPCPLAGDCPGCQLQHLRYDAQLEAKRRFVADSLERIGRLKDVEVQPTIGMAFPWHYRNKGEFTASVEAGRVRLGYHGEAGEGFVPVESCPIQHPVSLEILRATEEIATTESLPLAQLITRVSPSDRQALAILVCREGHDRLPAAAEALQERVPGLVGVLWSQVRGRSVVRRTLAKPLVGKERLMQRLGDWRYVVSAESFFPINNEQGARLLTLAQRCAGNLAGQVFVEGYCGVGTFLVPLAGAARRALGIEEHPAAVRDAGDNLAQHNLRGVRLYQGRVEVILPRLLRKGRKADVALLDPPRKGAGRAVLESLAGLGVRGVVLISCDPATFGRDAGDLAELGYRLTAVQPLDMFPQTWHVETIALAVKA